MYRSNEAIVAYAGESLCYKGWQLPELYNQDLSDVYDTCTVSAMCLRMNSISQIQGQKGFAK